MTSTTSQPDTDPQKRDVAGTQSGAPTQDVGGGGRPAGDTRPDAASREAPLDGTGARPGGAHPGGSPGAPEGGNGNPTTGGQSGAAQPRGDEPAKP